MRFNACAAAVYTLLLYQGQVKVYLGRFGVISIASDIQCTWEIVDQVNIVRLVLA